MNYHPTAHFNKAFAKAVLHAYMTGADFFMYKKNAYRTIKYINDVRRDLENGFYKFNLKIISTKKYV